jgi:hypothetical protein
VCRFDLRKQNKITNFCQHHLTFIEEYDLAAENVHATMSCTTTVTAGGTKLGNMVRLVVSFASSGQRMTTPTLILPTMKTRSTTSPLD